MCHLENKHVIESYANPENMCLTHTNSKTWDLSCNMMRYVLISSVSDLERDTSETLLLHAQKLHNYAKQ